ncbi:MAG: FCD domain-containing protein [Streptosporangiales bacterium]|nr:FCD domain-containing protein [Streptosporangiales bacterium]
MRSPSMPEPDLAPAIASGGAKCVWMSTRSKGRLPPTGLNILQCACRHPHPLKRHAVTRTRTRDMDRRTSVTDLLGFAQPRRTTHQFVRETLRRAILGGALAGGARLVQTDIAEQLQVSTTPVREALRDLAADGLIRFDPHRGAVVRELDLAELMEIYEIRKALEPLAIRKAAKRITPEQLAEAEALQDKMDAETDPGAWTELNGRFHRVLESASGAARLESIVKTVQDASAIYVAHCLDVQPARMRGGNREHRRLIAALRAGDGDRAARVLVEHLDKTLKSILASDKAPPG